jgi:hypothetical protein
MSLPLSHLLQRGRQYLAPFLGQILLPSLALTVLQIFMISLWSEESNYVSIFKGLIQWDSHWYLGIVRQGYQFVGFDKIAYEQSNVAFFPGYPLAVAGISRLLSVDPELGLYLTAQLFCWLMWVYLFLFYCKWQIPPLWQALASLLILVYPTSFYLCVGYSESLFTASLLGFLYWSIHWDRPLLMLLAGIHGLAMSATRIVGLPVALIPFLNLLNPVKRAGFRCWFWTGIVLSLALLGAWAFFSTVSFALDAGISTWKCSPTLAPALSITWPLFKRTPILLSFLLVIGDPCFPFLKLWKLGYGQFPSVKCLFLSPWDPYW